MRKIVLISLTILLITNISFAQKSYNIGTSPAGKILASGTINKDDWEVRITKASSDILSYRLTFNSNNDIAMLSFYIMRDYFDMTSQQTFHFTLSKNTVFPEDYLTGFCMIVDDNWIYPIDFSEYSSKAKDYRGFYHCSIMLDGDEELINILSECKELKIRYIVNGKETFLQIPDDFTNALKNF